MSEDSPDRTGPTAVPAERVQHFEVPASQLLTAPRGDAATLADAALGNLPARRYAVSSPGRGLVAHGALSLEELFARAGTTARSWAKSAPPDACVNISVVTSQSGNEVVVSASTTHRPDQRLVVTSISEAHATALEALDRRESAGPTFDDIVAASPERVQTAITLGALPHTGTFAQVLDELGRAGLDALDGGSRTVAAGLSRSWTGTPTDLVAAAAALGDSGHAPSIG